jgi:hypothetical protein
MCKNIGDIEILKGLASDLKLDAKSLHISLENGDYTAMNIQDGKNYPLTLSIILKVFYAIYWGKSVINLNSNETCREVT